MAPYNVTVNAVCPGILGTAMWLDHLIDRRVEQISDDRQATFAQYTASLIPLGCPQTPEDIGEAVVYLARADNVTGIALNVAGGLVMH
jgi:meso-butanediol dehydrogenase/(S,S)-butanediol dehydrogenase/diacetyl reductase